MAKTSKQISRSKTIWYHSRHQNSASDRKADNDSLVFLGFGEDCDPPDKVDERELEKVLAYWMPFIKRRVAKTTDVADRRRELIQCATIKIWQVVATHGSDVSSGLVWDAIKKGLVREDLRDKRRSSHVLRIRVKTSRAQGRSYYQMRKREVEDTLIKAIDMQWIDGFYRQTTGAMRQGLDAFMSDMTVTEWATRKNLTPSTVSSSLARAIAFGRALNDIHYKMSSPVDPIEALKRKGLTVADYYRKTRSA